jgi:hypothetical protein
MLGSVLMVVTGAGRGVRPTERCFCAEPSRLPCAHYSISDRFGAFTPSHPLFTPLSPLRPLFRRRQGLNLHQPIRAHSLYTLSLGVVLTAVYGMLLINLRPMSAPGRETSVQPP